VNISILLATRKRKHLLEKSINSLVQNAKDPTRIEIVFGIDEDDVDSARFVNSVFKHVRKKIISFKPIGYVNLHKYMNTLAAAGQGKWLFIWNDDALMRTENWDEIILTHGDEFKLLAPRDNHDGHPYAIFPIFPRDWFLLLDYVSNNPQNDRWLSEIAYALDIFERVDIECFHDRADLTGNNNDEIFKAREYKELKPEDPLDFDSLKNQKLRTHSMHKIGWYLDKIGQPSKFWKDVLIGARKPFEKMVMSKNMKGAGIHAALRGKHKNKS
jgi:hypothetical protein